MNMPPLTRRQQTILEHLRGHDGLPPTLDELCHALGLRSRGSLHKQVQALVAAGLVEPLNGRQRGVRLTGAAQGTAEALPLLGYIAAGAPIEAVAGDERIEVPAALHTPRPCYVLGVRGDSMCQAGILDGDWVVIEERGHARDGEIVVALIDREEATLKRIEQKPGEVRLHPANPDYPVQRYAPERVTIQGVLVGQMRRYT